MSPQQASFTSVVFLPQMLYRRPSLSVEEARTLRRDISELMLPFMTFTKLYLPNWSETVLKTKPWVGAAGSMPSISTGAGT